MSGTKISSSGRRSVLGGKRNKNIISSGMGQISSSVMDNYRAVIAQMTLNEALQEQVQRNTVPTMENVVTPQMRAAYSADWLLSGAMEGLNSTKKYAGQKRRFFSKSDSSEYKQVKNDLSEIISAMNTTFSEDADENKALLKDIAVKYQNLNKACSVYLKKKGGSTPAGKSRKEQTAMLLNLTQMDSVYIQYLAFDASPEELAGLKNQSWNQVLDYARAGKIEVENLFRDDNAFGSGVKTGERAGRRIDEGMFTQDDLISTDVEKQKFFETAFSDSKYYDSENKINNFDMGNDALNMSNRNVAMSRMANLLGIGGIIEQSKTVRVHDKETGQTLHGNLMTKAKGIQAAVVEESARKLDTGFAAEKDINKREEMVKGALAPSVQKELSSLQVLDYICGQGDRHLGNYFMESETDEEGKSVFTHIHGIDNDNAFSDGVDLEQEIKKRKMSVTKMKLVVDSEDNLVIAHIDEQLAKNIQNLTEDEIVIALKDLLEPSYLQYTLQRFRKVKTAVNKEMAKKEGSKIVKNNAWNEKTHNDFMNATRLYKELILPLREANVAGDDRQYLKMLGSLLKSDSNTIYEAVKGDSYYSYLVLRMMNSFIYEGSEQMIGFS